jgi:hypothetical protein
VRVRCHEKEHLFTVLKQVSRAADVNKPQGNFADGMSQLRCSLNEWRRETVVVLPSRLKPSMSTVVVDIISILLFPAAAALFLTTYNQSN